LRSVQGFALPWTGKRTSRRRGTAALTGRGLTCAASHSTPITTTPPPRRGSLPRRVFLYLLRPADDNPTGFSASRWRAIRPRPSVHARPACMSHHLPMPHGTAVPPKVHRSNGRTLRRKVDAPRVGDPTPLKPASAQRIECVCGTAVRPHMARPPASIRISARTACAPISRASALVTAQRRGLT
jgi:hypothetical protein